jgi:hypothetical protein
MNEEPKELPLSPIAIEVLRRQGLHVIPDPTKAAQPWVAVPATKMVLPLFEFQQPKGDENDDDQ